jgi:preprotein translocase subunit YajC
MILSTLKLLTLSLTSNAQAQAAAQSNPLTQFLPLIVVFGIFYFLMIRPQKKKFDQEQAMLSELKKGDEVYTKSGLIGTVYGLSDKIITLEGIEGVKYKVLRSQIGGLLKTIMDEK